MARPPGIPYYSPSPFEFDFKEGDPQLDFMRRNILLGGQRQRRNTTNEIYRAGLGGTGVGLEAMRDVNQDIERNLGNVEGSIYGARRGEAHGDYQSNQDFIRQMMGMRYGAQLGDWNRSQESRMMGLGQIGQLGGSLLQDWFRTNMLGWAPYNFNFGGGTEY